MKLIISNSLKRHSKNENTLSITLTEFSRDRISRLKREWIATFHEIEFSYGLERWCDLRKVIKEADILLKIDGEIIINISKSKTGLNINHGNFFRSKSQLKSEFQLTTFGRYDLIEEKHLKWQSKFIYRKRKKTLKKTDSISKWSFGIITNGSKIDQINKLIKSIEEQKIPEYEIIICGPHPKSGNLKILEDIKNTDTRAPINRKKNKIISNCSFENIVILHDRFIIPKNWYSNMVKYGNYFEILQMPNKDLEGRNVNDWPTFRGDPHGIKFRINKGNDFGVFSKEVYIPGGSYIGKKWIFQKFKLNNLLHWDELEDVIFSRLLVLNGVYFYFDPNNFLTTQSYRLSSKKIQSRLLSEIVSNIKWLLINFYNRTIYYVNQLFN